MLVRNVPCTPAATASLAHYSPSARQAPHSHDFTQISFLLGGELLERQGRREYVVDRAARGYKPAGVLHEDFWGSDGTLIFSLKVPADQEALGDPPGWLPLAEGACLGALIRTCLLDPGVEARQEAVIDLLAVPVRASPPLRIAPAAVARAREAIRAAPEVVDVAAAAKEAGVNRVHFSRLFQAAYGYAPSVFRRRVATARALSRILAQPESLSAIAVDSGFSDQAHMTRAVRGLAGMPPAALKRFMRATPVQAGPSRRE